MTRRRQLDVATASLDLSKSLVEAPALGHNRFHPDIDPIAEVQSGTRIEADVRDGFDGQIVDTTLPADILNLDMGRAHPLTGPFYLKGAEPGDYLEVEILAIQTRSFGQTCILPNVGLLAGLFAEPYVVKWDIENGVARSRDLPRVSIRGEPFLGLVGVAPAHERMNRIAAREAELVASGGVAMLPDVRSAVPQAGRIGVDGLRTVPPREIGGNMDIKHLHSGCRVLLHVDVPGALVSVGDIHFAQGDGESCGVAIEVAGHVSFRCQLIKAHTLTWRPRQPVYRYHSGISPRGRRDYLATTGIPVSNDGGNRNMDVYLAAQQALLEMIDYLVHERNYSRQQAYVLVSVAADLSISSIVNVPNPLVSAIMPLDIFD